LKAKKLKAALVADDTLAKWSSSPWAKRLAVSAKKKSLTDFERFRLMLAKKKRAALVKGVLKPTKKKEAASKKGKK